MNGRQIEGAVNGAPWGVIGMIALLVVVESYVWRHHPDLAPIYSGEWSKTGRVVRREAARSEILCFGDSLVKVGVAPVVLEHRLGKRAYNFALSGGQSVSSYFMLRHALESGARPTAIILDSKWTALAHSYWLDVPLLPAVLTVGDCFDLGVTTREARVFGELIASKVFTSYFDRYQIRADVITALAGGTPPRRGDFKPWARNWIVNHGAHHAPKNTHYQGEIDPKDLGLLAANWMPNPVVQTYLERFLDLAHSRGIPVFWLLNPVTTGLQAKLDENGAAAAYTRLAQRYQRRYPNLVVVDGRQAQYPNTVFIDPSHLDRDGAAICTDDLAAIIGKGLANPARTQRWVNLPRFREREIGFTLEDVDESSQKIAARGRELMR